MVIAAGAAMVQASQSAGATGAVPCPAQASVPHLNVNGTAIVASLASTSSSIAATTRNFRSPRSDGQMKGQRRTTVVNRPPRSAEITRFSWLRGWVPGGSMKLRASNDRRQGQPGNIPSYRALAQAGHPEMRHNPATYALYAP